MPPCEQQLREDIVGTGRMMYERGWIAANDGNLNLAEFCDPKIDAEIARARTMQTIDPPAATRLWSKIDRDIVDQAPWIFSDNPREADFVSRRVGNYQYSQSGILLDQLWVN